MKQKTKRILAFAMAVVFELSTCVTSSPYTVMATEAGETIAPLAEEGSGSEAVTPGSETPKPTPKTYLKVVCDAGLIENVPVGQVSLKFAGQENVMHVILKENNIIEDGLTVESCTSDNYNVTYEEKTETKDEDTYREIQITKLTPKTEITGADSITTLTTVPYKLIGVWANVSTNWTVTADTTASVDGNGQVYVEHGGQNITLQAAIAGNLVASKTIPVTKAEPTLTINCSSNAPWDKSVEVSGKLTVNGKGLANETIHCWVGDKKVDVRTDENGDYKGTIELKKYFNILMQVKTEFDETAKCQGTDAIFSKGYQPGKVDGKIFLKEDHDENNPLNITYGTQSVVERITKLTTNKDKELGSEDQEIQELSAKSSDDAVAAVSVNKDTREITITPVNASDKSVRVTITAETANYKFKKELFVKVNPYKLKLEESVSVAGTDKTEYNNTKTYDATDRVDVQATLTGDDTLTDAAKTIAEEKFKNIVFKGYQSGIVNVDGNQKVQKFTFAPKDFSLTQYANSKDITDNFVIEDQKTEAEVTILKRTLNLTVADSTRPYRSLGYTRALDQLVSVNPPSGDTGFAGKDAIENLDRFTYPTVVDTTATGLTPDNVKKNDTATCSEHTNALELDKKSGDPTSNYKFDFNFYKHGNLKVTEENITDATDYVTINNNASTHAYENEDHVRYYGKDAVIKFALEGGYNKIYLKNGTDLTTEGLKDEKEYVAGYTPKEEIYLAKVNNDGEVLNRTNTFEITFIYDPDAPQCSEIKFGEENKVVTNLATTITFGIYKNKNIEVTVKFSDKLSGIKGWSYFVANTDKDSFFKELLTEDDYAEKLTNAHFTAGTDTYTVPVGKLKDGQTLESNNYIVFVKVMDNVGNSKIYGSNGIVLENFHDITVTYKEDPAETTTQQGTVNSRTYYSGDAKLNLTAKENASESKFYSGLEKMQYTISRHWGDGKKDTEEEATETNEYGFPKDVSLEELQKYCTIEKLLELKNNPEKSQVITVSATANDNAGNAMETRADYTLVLDSIAPTVESSYAQANNNGAFLNAKYANSDVTYSVNVTERFLNVLKVTLNGVTYTLEELNSQKDALGIKEISMDPVNDFADTTDSTVYKFTIVFHKDGEYTVQTKVADAAGNTGEDKEFSFVIDTVRPEMQVTYTAYRPNGTSFVLDPSRGRAYANEEVAYVAVTAVITERNFDAKDAKVAYTAVNSKGKAVKVADYDAAIREEWTNKGNVSTEDNRFVYELSLPTISVDANYDFAYDYTDLAGNPINETIKQAVTLDRVKPEGTVTVEDLVNGSASETWNKFLSVITFGHFGKNSVRASMTSDDETAGVAATQYLTSAKALTRSELEARTGWTGYSSKISLAASQNLVVYEKITDKAGNIQYISTDGIIVDNVAPVVKITPTNPGWGKGVYSATDNPGFDISVTDPVVNDAYAGLKTISYTITNGTTGYVESGTLANLERTSHLLSWTGHATINPDNFYSNDVRVKVTADDWSTNDATSEEISIKVDNKAPIATFSFDQSDVHNGKYYNNDKTLTITVDERNFDESYQPQVTSTAGGGYSISGWSHNGEIHTATVTFSGDSDYTVTYDCFDLAGNKSNTEKLDEFTVDKTKPVIQVSYDNNSALNNNYYKEARTATITITEHNFSPGEVTVTTTAQLDGAAASVPGVSGWSGSGDTHVATVSYSADADYTFTISATDLASNVSDPYATESFTVDQTKPTVEITNIEDRSANNGEVAPVITLNDINFDSGKTVVHLTGANKGEVDTTGMYTSTASNKGQTLTFYNFKENMDDIYTLTAEATDKAGNQYSTSKIFSVNRDGSTYLYDNYTEELIKNGYTNDPKNLVVSEINVDTLTFQELTVSENGTQKTLEPNKDFEVSESGSDVSWKEYKYTINASNFENEGDYNVSIYSEDRATNVTTNTAKSKDILFAVDKTSPVISLANIEDCGRYKVESQKFTANVDDNMALDKVEYYVDDELKQTFDADEVSANGGSLDLSVDSSNTFRNVSVKAYDKANNEATTASVDVLVSANTWVQFYNNKPAFYGTIGGGVAAVVAAVAAGVHFSGAAVGTAAAAGKTAAGAGIFLAGKKRKKMKSK